MFEQIHANQPKIAVVTSRFNQEITQKLYEGAMARFQEKGVTIAAGDIFFVPGAIEIPVLVSRLAREKKYDAIVCLGAVVRGETDHYDYVCWQVSYGCQKVAIEHCIPVIFGILTTDNEEQAFDRCGGANGHKGVDCADAALEMVALLRAI